MKAKIIITVLITALAVIGCSKAKDSTEQIHTFKESVYGYMYSAQSMATFIADNIEQYERGLRYFDTENGYLTYSNGEYCESVEDVVAIIRERYRQMKSVDVIQSYKAEAYRHLPEGKPDLQSLYELAKDMDELATTAVPSHTYGTRCNTILESFSTKFAVSDNTYPNTAVNYEDVQGGIIRLQETLMGLETK